MNINNLASSLQKNIDKIGMIGGFYLSATQKADAWFAEEGHTFDMISITLQELMNKPHFPDFGHVLKDLTVGYSSKIVIPAATAAILGEVLKGVGYFGKWGKVLADGGVAVLKGSVIWSVLSHAGLEHSPHPIPTQEQVDHWLSPNNERKAHNSLLTQRVFT